MINQEPILATIELENGEGVGELYWQDGSIYCRRADGESWDTDTPCSRRDALHAIVSAWGEPRSTKKAWGLRLRSRQAERHYGLR